MVLPRQFRFADRIGPGLSRFQSSRAKRVYRDLSGRYPSERQDFSVALNAVDRDSPEGIQDLRLLLIIGESSAGFLPGVICMAVTFSVRDKNVRRPTSPSLHKEGR